ncbi:hypothetical protein [Ignatzschineria sp. LJL83]
MKLFYKWIVCFFLTLGISIANAGTLEIQDYRQAVLPKPAVSYSINWRTKIAFCIIRVNGLPLFNNADSIGGYVFTGFGIDGFLYNGNNTISIEMVPYWADTTGHSEEAIKQYQEKVRKNERYCLAEISKSTIENDEIREEMIGVLKLSIDSEDHIFIHEETFDLDDPLSPNNTVNRGKVSPEDIVEYQDLTSLSRNVQVVGAANWIWVESPSFSEIKNAEQQLLAAYEELWIALNNKDRKALKSLIDINLYERYLGSTGIPKEIMEEERLDVMMDNFGYSEKDFENMEVLPFKNQGFKVIEYAGGRMVQMVDEKGFSPIEMRDKNTGEVGSAIHNFSYIDGKFRVVR